MTARRQLLTTVASLIAGLLPNPAMTQNPVPAQPSGIHTAEVKQGGPGGPGGLGGPIGGIIAPPPIFYLRSYLGKCLDFGTSLTSGTQVYLSDCDDSTEQQVLVEEVDSQHDVILHAGSKVLGFRPPFVGSNPGAFVATSSGAPAPATPVYALELQDLPNPNSPAVSPITSANQTFALDGDSIILASDPRLVVQVQNALVANGSPLVVAARSLADSEFWDFNQIGGADIDPTSGFVRAGYPGSTATAYDILLSRVHPWNGPYCQNASPACQPSPAQPGTVIRIYPGADINLSGLQPLQIPSGVTITLRAPAPRTGPLDRPNREGSGRCRSPEWLVSGTSTENREPISCSGVTTNTCISYPVDPYKGMLPR